MIRLATLTILAGLMLAPAAQAANPAERVAAKLTTLHRSLNHYPAGATTRTTCVGTIGARQWSCTATTTSPSMLNGGDSFKYVCTARFIRRNHSTVLVGFKAYAVGAIA